MSEGRGQGERKTRRQGKNRWAGRMYSGPGGPEVPGEGCT